MYKSGNKNKVQKYKLSKLKKNKNISTHLTRRTNKRRIKVQKYKLNKKNR